jgi:hypothetical protein
MPSAYTITFETSGETTAAPEVVDGLYRDATTWSAWDPGMECVEFDGPFEAGMTGRFTPVGGEPFPYTMVFAEPGRGHVDEFPLDGAVLQVSHRLEPLAGGGTRIVHGASLSGPKALEIAPGLMPDVCDEMPETVARLAQVAESRS